MSELRDSPESIAKLREEAALAIYSFAAVFIVLGLFVWWLSNPAASSSAEHRRYHDYSKRMAKEAGRPRRRIRAVPSGVLMHRLHRRPSSQPSLADTCSSTVTSSDTQSQQRHRSSSAEEQPQLGTSVEGTKSLTSNLVSGDAVEPTTLHQRHPGVAMHSQPQQELHQQCHLWPSGLTDAPPAHSHVIRDAGDPERAPSGRHSAMMPRIGEDSPNSPGSPVATVSLPSHEPTPSEFASFNTSRQPDYAGLADGEAWAQVGQAVGHGWRQQREARPVGASFGDRRLSFWDMYAGVEQGESSPPYDQQQQCEFAPVYSVKQVQQYLQEAGLINPASPDAASHVASEQHSRLQQGPRASTRQQHLAGYQLAAGQQQHKAAAVQHTSLGADRLHGASEQRQRTSAVLPHHTSSHPQGLSSLRQQAANRTAKPQDSWRGTWPSHDHAAAAAMASSAHPHQDLQTGYGSSSSTTSGSGQSLAITAIVSGEPHQRVKQTGPLEHVWRDARADGDASDIASDAMIGSATHLPEVIGLDRAAFLPMAPCKLPSITEIGAEGSSLSTANTSRADDATPGEEDSGTLDAFLEDEGSGLWSVPAAEASSCSAEQELSRLRRHDPRCCVLYQEGDLQVQVEEAEGGSGRAVAGWMAEEAQPASPGRVRRDDTASSLLSRLR